MKSQTILNQERKRSMNPFFFVSPTMAISPPIGGRDILGCTVSEEEIMDKRTKRRFWAAHVAAWQHSGLTQTAYCREYGLSRHAFGWWRRKLETSRQASSRCWYRCRP
ncbi:MAG: hypothetical protein U5J62_01235 [Desulfurivibrio sp.]|nr:hypothetical protein [Desulfurivibrio sp.]